MVEDEGYMMTFSCSGHMSLDLFQKVIFSAALDARRRISIVRRLAAGIDHPVSMYGRESEYLKGFLLKVHAAYTECPCPHSPPCRSRGNCVRSPSRTWASTSRTSDSSTIARRPR